MADVSPPKPKPAPIPQLPPIPVGPGAGDPPLIDVWETIKRLIREWIGRQSDDLKTTQDGTLETTLANRDDFNIAVGIAFPPENTDPEPTMGQLTLIVALTGGLVVDAETIGGGLGDG